VSVKSLDILLVHGGWHSGAAWAPLLPRLAAAGHRPIAIDLPAHGMHARFPAGYLEPQQEEFPGAPSPIADTTLEMAADAVVAALAGLESSGDRDRPRVLVSHSSGGAVATMAAEKAPSLVDHLVYVAAVVPTLMPTIGDYGALPEYGSQTMDGLVVGDPASTGALRINPRSRDGAYRKLLRHTMFADVDEATFEAACYTLTPDQPIRYIVDPVGATSERWGSIPRSYVLTRADQSIAPAVQRRIIGDADVFAPAHPFVVHEVDSGHSIYLSRPDELARLIDGVV